jgi:hypothetical protein
MGRLTWTETLDGWISGRYHIELAAPRLWVLSRHPKTNDGSAPVPVKVMRTAGSLREMKHLADELERRRVRRHRLLTHLAMTSAVVTIALIGAALGWDLTLPAVVAVFAFALRTLVVWVENATGSAWSVISDHYQ